MRKGRSSRRSRAPRSIGTKALQNLDTNPTPSTPNVVIGVIGDTPSAPVAATNVATAPARDTLVVPPNQEDEYEDEGPSSEQRVRVEGATLDSTPPEPEPEPEALEAQAPSEPSEPPPPVEPIESMAAVVIETKPEPEPEASMPEPIKAAAPVAEEEESIPPIGDLVAKVHEEFFSQGDVSSLLPPDDDDLDSATADKVARLRAPEVVQRRAKLARYVSWAVGVSAVVCLAAVARTALTPAKVIASNAGPVANAAVLVAPPPVEKAAPPPEVSTTPAPAAAEATPPPVVGDAKEEKAKCKKALETRKLADAIEAGERSVAIDQTDGEAWLLLGASYQEKGDLPNARKAYGSCTKLGTASKFTRECAQMLR